VAGKGIGNHLTTRKEILKMKKNKKLLIGIGMVFVLCVIVFGVYKNCQEPHDNRSIQVGVLSFLTGTYGQMGTDFLRGIQLYADEVNNTRMRENKKSEKISLEIEDGKANAKESINCFNRLLLHKPRVMIVAGDYQVAAIAPLADKTRIPIVTSIVGNQSFMDYNKGGWMFRNWLPITLISRVVARYAYKGLRAKKSAILFSQTEYGEDAASAYKDEFTKLGGLICSEQTYAADTHSVRDLVVRILNDKPDQIFVTGYGPGYIAALQQIRECGWNGLILTDTTATNPETLSNVNNMEGIVFADTIFGDEPASDVVRVFKEAYRQKYSSEANIYAAFGYDTMRIIVECISSEDSSEMIREKIKRIKFNSLSGLVKFTESGDCDIEIAIKMMKKDGKHIAVRW